MNIIYNQEKFKAMLHYIISKCESKDNLEPTALFKLLYFSDFDNYEKYEHSISGETYIRQKMELVPKHFQKAINELINENKIIKKAELTINYSSLVKPNTNLFSSEELEVINDTINRISHYSSREINEYSHGDIPWRIAKEGEPLNYESVFYREEEYSVREYDG